MEANDTDSRLDPSRFMQGLPDHAAKYMLAGESLDHVCTVELRSPGMPRGFLSRLYEAARSYHRAPLGLLAASRLRDVLPAPRLPVIIGTAAGRPVVQPKGETDGPIGAAALARALHIASGATPVFVCGDEFTDPVVAAAEAAGFTFLALPEASQRLFGACLIPVPTRADAKEHDHARAVLDEVGPAAVVAIERPGPNALGVTHSTLGTASPTPVATIGALLLAARQRGLLTIGIGDAGNEVGFGVIAQSVRSIHPLGAQCRCPCGGGVACVVPADVVVVASCSNLGAYNVAACLALLTGQREALVSPALEARLFEACVRAGAEEAAHGRDLWCDGIPLEAHSAFVRIIEEVVSVEARAVQRPW